MDWGDGEGRGRRERAPDWGRIVGVRRAVCGDLDACGGAVAMRCYTY